MLASPSPSPSPALSLPSSIDDDHAPPPPDDHDDVIADLEAHVAALQARHREAEEENAQLRDVVHRLRAQEQQQRSSSPPDDETGELRASLHAAQRRLVGLSDQLEFHVHENERLASETATLRAQMQGLDTELQAAQATVRRRVDKEQAFDALAAQAKALQQGKEALETRCATHAAALQQAKAVEDCLQRRLAEAAHQQSMADLDKDFLTKELEARTHQHAATEHALRSTQEELRALSASRENWHQQLQEAKMEAERTCQTRLDEERRRLQDGHSKEWTDAHAAIRDVLERENTELRQAREDAVGHVERLRQELQLLQQTHEHLILRLVKNETTAKATVLERLAEMKIKAFEVARLETLLDEKTRSLAVAEQQVAALQTELFERRHECERLEARAARKEHELALAADKVASYEVLETQMDAAVASIRTGGRTSTAALASLGSVPRRMQHAVLLATRLRDKELELQVLRQEWRAMKAQVDAWAGRREQEQHQQKQKLQHDYHSLLTRPPFVPKTPKWHKKL